MAVVARNVIAKFRSNFDFFFGDNPELFDETKQSNAISRLEAMSEVAMRIQEKSFDYVDGKYGVHGGVGSPGAVEIIATAPTIASPKGTFDKLGKSFHIFQASPPGTASVGVSLSLYLLFAISVPVRCLFSNFPFAKKLLFIGLIKKSRDKLAHGII